MVVTSTQSRTRRVRIVVAVCLTTLGLAACGGDDTSSGNGGPSTLTLPWIPIAGLAPFQVGADNGCFDEAGIQIERLDVQSPADAIPNLLSGRASIVSANVGGLANAKAQDLPLKVIGPGFNLNGSEQGIYVRSDSPIQRPADLSGRRVGVIALENNVTALYLENVERDGGDPSTVEFVLLPAANIADAIESGAVDAGQMLEPFLTLAGDELRPVMDDFQSVVSPETALTYVVTTESFLAENPALIESFQGAYTCAIEASEDDQAVRDAIATYSEVDPSVLAEIGLPGFSTELNQDQAEAQVALMKKFGFVEESVDITDYFE